MTWTPHPPEPPPRKARRESPRTLLQRFSLPWRYVFGAALPIGLAVYYLAWVAPSSVPVPAGVNVPFPPATELLESVCSWCGAHRWAVAGIGLGLLVPGMLFRFIYSAERYYVAVGVVMSLSLGFTYLSISAPVDRLIHAVEEQLPEDSRVPAPAPERRR